MDILSGRKSFSRVDYEGADGGLRIGRTFQVRASVLGHANWTPDFAYELALGPDWSSNRDVLVHTPQGGSYTFRRQSSGEMAPLVNSTYPLPQTDYALAFEGTWPASLNAVTATKSRWRLTGPDDTVWVLESVADPTSGVYDIARPVSLIRPDGEEWTFVYSAKGELRSITDGFGRQVRFDWLAGERPHAIEKARLPGGETVAYVYDSISGIVGTEPYVDRLIRVEYRDANGVLQDQESYAYGDERFPYFVTEVLDKDGVTRWSVTYNDLGRVTSSAGPGGTDAHSFAYGADGTTITRTVTNALGKQAIYTFTRSSTGNYGIKLTSVAGQASANCPAATRSLSYAASHFLSATVDEEGRSTQFQRDAKGRPTQVKAAAGTAAQRVVDVTWDANRNQPATIVEPQKTTSFAYAPATSAGPYAPSYVQVHDFGFTGAAQEITVASGLTSVTVRLWGGGGGNGNYSTGSWSGAGGYAEASFAVSPGDVLKVEVAGGGQGALRGGDGGAGGWPDGGGGAKGTGSSGGGGGSSRFYINGALRAVAAGGGGAGGHPTYGNGGAGGGAEGQASTSASGGTGGTQTAGGVDGNDTGNANKTGRSIVAFPGVQRTGGWGSTVASSTVSTSDDGGGGGGGYWGGGGGGGDMRSGGGGSSWAHPSASAVRLEPGHQKTPFNPPPGQPDVAKGVNSGSNGPAVAGGDGYAILGLK